MPSRSDPLEARTAKPFPRGHAAEVGIVAAKRGTIRKCGARKAVAPSAVCWPVPRLSNGGANITHFLSVPQLAEPLKKCLMVILATEKMTAQALF